MTDAAFQRCINPDCAATLAVDDTSFRCPRCGDLLDVVYDWDRLAPALARGAPTVQIAGDCDDAMLRVQQVARRLGIYLVNSINPFRLEGQKAVMYRVLEALRWEPPDWVVVPGGNLGNVSAFGKAFLELAELGLVPRLPRLAVINAGGANTFYQLYARRGLRWNAGRPEATTVDGYYRGLDAGQLR